jgi:hypothetical protein
VVYIRCLLLQVVDSNVDPEWTLLYYLRTKCIPWSKQMTELIVSLTEIMSVKTCSNMGLVKQIRILGT